MEGVFLLCGRFLFKCGRLCRMRTVSPFMRRVKGLPSENPNAPQCVVGQSMLHSAVAPHPACLHVAQCPCLYSVPF